MGNGLLVLGDSLGLVLGDGLGLVLGDGLGLVLGESLGLVLGDCLRLVLGDSLRDCLRLVLGKDLGNGLGRSSWNWGLGKMVSFNLETVLASGVLHSDGLAFGVDVAVLSSNVALENI